MRLLKFILWITLLTCTAWGAAIFLGPTVISRAVATYFGDAVKVKRLDVSPALEVSAAAVEFDFPARDGAPAVRGVARGVTLGWSFGEVIKLDLGLGPTRVEGLGFVASAGLSLTPNSNFNWAEVRLEGNFEGAGVGPHAAELGRLSADLDAVTQVVSGVQVELERVTADVDGLPAVVPSAVVSVSQINLGAPIAAQASDLEVQFPGGATYAGANVKSAAGRGRLAGGVIDFEVSGSEFAVPVAGIGVENFNVAAAFDTTHQVLGDAVDFKLENISKQFIEKLKSLNAGKRILALIQVSQYHKASREFRKIIFNSNEKEYPEIISFASKNNMPGFAFRLSAILRNDHNKILLGGLYPVPDWNLTSLPIKDKSLLFSISRQESGFNPRAKSYANALGLMQVLPSTASFIMKDRAYRKKEMLYDEEKNLYVASKYIQFLLNLDIIKNDVSKMLASYNAGPGNFSKWSKSFYKTEIDPIFMIETLPARQTRNYIKLVLTNLWIYKIRLNEKPDLLFKLASGSIPKYEFKNDR